VERVIKLTINLYFLNVNTRTFLIIHWPFNIYIWWCIEAGSRY